MSKSNRADKSLEVANMMHDIHATMRNVYGEDFSKLVAKYEPILKAVMKRDNCDEALASLKLCQELKRVNKESSSATLAIIATACEMITRPA